MARPSKTTPGKPASKQEEYPWNLPVPEPTRYETKPDPLFPGTWMSLPVNYRNRGPVYLYHGENAEKEARAWTRWKNKQLREKHKASLGDTKTGKRD